MRLGLNHHRVELRWVDAGVVNDDHRLHYTVKTIDWLTLVGDCQQTGMEQTRGS